MLIRLSSFMLCCCGSLVMMLLLKFQLRLCKCCCCCWGSDAGMLLLLLLLLLSVGNCFVNSLTTESSRCRVLPYNEGRVKQVLIGALGAQRAHCPVRQSLMKTGYYRGNQQTKRSISKHISHVGYILFGFFINLHKSFRINSIENYILMLSISTFTRRHSSPDFFIYPLHLDHAARDTEQDLIIWNKRM